MLQQVLAGGDKVWILVGIFWFWLLIGYQHGLLPRKQPMNTPSSLHKAALAPSGEPRFVQLWRSPIQGQRSTNAQQPPAYHTWGT